MSATFRSDYPLYSSQLQQREAELRRTLEAEEATVLHAGGGAGEVTDFKEVAGSEALAAVEDVKAAHAAAELSQVLAAQRRLRDGTYGSCLGCGSQIDPSRLLALPSASLCMACQRLNEQSR